jgi:hypothetical protein
MDIVQKQRVREYQNRPILLFEHFSELNRDQHEREMRYMTKYWKTKTWLHIPSQGQCSSIRLPKQEVGVDCSLPTASKMDVGRCKRCKMEPITGSQRPTGPRPQTIPTKRSWIRLWLRHWCVCFLCFFKTDPIPIWVPKTYQHFTVRKIIHNRNRTCSW